MWSPKESLFGATVLSVGALAFTVAACVLFTMDVATPPAVSRERFLRARWYTPLLHEVRGVEDRMVGGVVLDGPLVDEALASEDARKFPKTLARALESYSEVLKQYNTAASRLGDFVVRHVQTLGACTDAAAMSGRGRILTPGRLLRSEDVDGLVKTLVEERDVTVAVEVQHANWSRVVCTFARNLLPASKQEVAKKFHDARVAMSASSEARIFEGALVAAENAAKALRTELERSSSE